MSPALQPGRWRPFLEHLANPNLDRRLNYRQENREIRRPTHGHCRATVGSIQLVWRCQYTPNRQTHGGGQHMIRIIAAMVACVALVSVYAVSPSLARAARRMPRSEETCGCSAEKLHDQVREVMPLAACDTKAGAQKLAGAAKNSFTKKCVTEAVGG